MLERYPVYLEKQAVGQVEITKQGMYYLLDCRCHLPGDEAVRLILDCSGRQQDLGILVPHDGDFGMKARISVRHLEEGTPAFYVKPRHEKAEGSFVPVSPEKPLPDLLCLEKAVLAVQDGQVGLLLPK